MKNLAIFFSGKGSNMQAIINSSKCSTYGASIKLLICNNVSAPGIDIASKSGIKLSIIENGDNQLIYNEVIKEKIDFIALAGYTNILKGPILEKYQDRIFNIHPSLLPLYRGKNAQEQTLKNNAKISGCTVHLVNKHIDKGKILGQMIVPILANDNIESLQKRILRQEHILYPKIISSYIKTFIKN